MASLTQEQLSQLEAAKNGGQVLQYYTLLSGIGDAYGDLARSVADGTGISGQVARGFAAAVAEEHGVVLNADAWPNISLRLMQEDFDARVAAGAAGQDNVNLNYQAIMAYHVEVFGEFGLPPEAWTAYAPLTLAGDQASAIWDSLKQVDWLGQLLSGGSVVLEMLAAHIATTNEAWLDTVLPDPIQHFFSAEALATGPAGDLAGDWLRNMFLRGAAFAEFGPGGAVESVRVPLGDPDQGDLVYGSGRPFLDIPDTLLAFFNRGAADDPHLVGTERNDEIFGFSGDDGLSGGDGDDGLAGGSGSDTLDGGAGNDVLIGGDQGYTELLGLGVDVATYSHAAGGVVLTLQEDTASHGIRVTSDGNGGSDVLIGIEKIELSEHDDRVVVRPDDGSQAIKTLQTIDAGANGDLGDELDLRALSTGVVFDNGYLREQGKRFENFEKLNFGTGADQVRSNVANAQIDLGAGDDELVSAAAGTRVWGGAGADTFHLMDDVRIEDADADDRISFHGLGNLTGGIHWNASANPYAMHITGTVGYGLNHDGDLVIHDFVFNRDMFIADYVGGPGAPQNDAGIYVAQIDIAVAGILSDWASSKMTQGGAWEALLGGFMKANFGVSFWAGVDPLVLDLDGDGLELAGRSMGPLTFDIDADGYGENTGWVKADDGILVLDANANGKVDDGSEMFGGAAQSGFAELATLDQNHDGKIDAADPAFAELRVWRDLDQDMQTDDGELFTLDQLGITWLGVTGAPSNATNATNAVLETGSFSRVNGSTGSLSDVSFHVDNQNTVFLGDKTISAAAEALPELKGYGTLPDLRVAMTLSPDLQGVVADHLPALNTLDLPAMRAAAEPILLAWAQAAPVNGQPPLAAHHDVPLLLRTVDGKDAVADFAYQETDATTGEIWWTLASGRSVHDGNGSLIEKPTLEQLQADTGLDGHWSSLDGNWISFFERYMGEALPLDSVPTDVPGAAAHMNEIIDGLWSLANSISVRLAMQGPLHDFFPGLSYDASQDAFVATTNRELVPTFEAVFDDAVAAGDALSKLHVWQPVLSVVIGDYKQPDGLLNTNGFLFSNVVAGYERSGLSLPITEVADALGLPADLVRFGAGAVAGGDDADLFYLSAGDQTMSGGLGPDTYVVGKHFGHDVIVDLEPAGQAHSEDVVRFADIDSTQVTARRDGIDLVLTVNGTDDELRIKDHFDGRTPDISGNGDLSDDTGVDLIVFADGVRWTPFDVARAVSRPDATNQNITGTDTVDWLDGGAGDDTLSGGSDVDVYVFGRGYGADVVIDHPAHALLGGPDFISFKPDVTLEDVHFSRQGNSDDLIITLAGDPASLRITGEFTATYTGPFGTIWMDQIEAFHFNDGTELGWKDVANLVLRQAITDGDDQIYGFSLEDDLAGGKGDDTISGGNENDTYRYSLGDGHDVIADAPGNILSGLTDRVIFGPGIDPDSVVLERPIGTDDLRLTFADGGTILIKSQFTVTSTGAFGDIWMNRIESFTFQDAPGVTWDNEFLMARLLQSAKSTGDDTIDGFWREDRLDGGAGDDLLRGGPMSDVYAFGRGYGHDSVYEAYDLGGNTDVVEMQAGVAPTDIILERLGASPDLTLRISGTDDRLTLLNQNAFANIGGYQHQVEEVRFADGTVWTAQFVREEFVRLAKTPGADTIDGFAGADTLSGGLGDDTLDGHEGADLYRFDAGDGNDVIIEGNGSIFDEDADTLEFGPGITQSMVHGLVVGSDLQLNFNGLGDRLTIRDQFLTEYTDIEFFRFSDGTQLTEQQFLDLVLPIAGTFGADTITGTDFGNSIDGLAGADTISGLGGEDLLSGGAGNDTLNGGDGADTLVGGADADLLVGGAGTDIFLWTRGDGADVISEGFDYYSSADKLVLQGINPGEVSLTGSGGDVFLTISPSTPGGADGGSVKLLANLDEYINTGVEQISFADGTIWTRADLRTELLAQAQTSSADSIVGYNTADVIGGGQGADTINAGDGNDLVTGGAGNDSLIGGSGADTFFWARGDGADVISEGFDYYSSADKLVLQGINPSEVSLAQSGGDVVLTISPSTPGGADGGSVKLLANLDEYINTSVEQISFADGTIWTRADLRTELLAQAQTSGADSIMGYNTADVIGGGQGADTINAGDGNDLVTGGAGSDSLIGGSGADTFFWARGDGADVISEGFDYYSSADKLELQGINPSEVSLAQSGGDVVLTISPSTPGGADGGSVKLLANLDEYINTGVEQISFADGTIWTRADLRTELLAQAQTSGADSIMGYNTADTLIGGPGADTLSGGSGADVFRYLSAGDSVAGARDIIIDFASGSDKIDLSALDANANTPSDDAFSFIGASAFTHSAGELRSDPSMSGQTIIEGDLDGDGLPDFQIELVGTFSLSEATFVL